MQRLDLASPEAAPIATRAGGGAPAVARRAIPLLPLVVALAALARALAAPAALLHDPDTYLHIAAGRWMLAHRALPLHDPFSHSLPGAAWVPHEWLSQLVLALAYGLAGWNGVVLLTALCFALAIGLFAQLLLRSAEPFSATIATALGAALVLGHLLARPHLLALPLLVLWAGALFAARDRGRVPSLWLLPVMTLWANLHGGFMFGVALAGFVAIEAALAAGPRSREARGWALFVVGAAAAALLTPNGLAGLLQPFRLMAMPALQSSFGEWQSPNFQGFGPIEIVLLGLIATGLASGIKLPPMRLALLLGLCHMALQSVRHAEILGLVGSLAIAGALGPPIAARLRALPASSVGLAFARLASPAPPPALAAAAALAVMLCLPLLRHPIVRQDDAVTPARALAAAERLGLTAGPVFNSESFGGYLIFRGVKPFIDGRIEMYGNDFLARDVKAEGGERRALAAILDRYRIAWALLAPDRGAAAALAVLPGWQRVYRDPDAVLYRRSSQ